MKKSNDLKKVTSSQAKEGDVNFSVFDSYHSKSNSNPI